MKRPFKPPSCIALVGVSSPYDPIRLDEGVAVLEDLFRGVRVLRAPNMGREHGYLAGTDDERIAGLEWAFASGAEIVWCVRGGYGATRILDRIDWTRLAGTGVTLMGYSDASAPLIAFAGGGGRAIHGPMVAADLAARDPRTIQSLRNHLLEDLPDRFTFNGTAHGDGREVISGTIVVSNIELLAALCGTRFLPTARDAVVLLEEVKESPYRIDRSLTQLIAAGFFQGARAVVFGSMEKCVPTHPGPSLTLPQLYDDFAERTGLPVVAGFPFGHGDVNTLLPLGGTIRLSREDDRWSAQVTARP